MAYYPRMQALSGIISKFSGSVFEAAFFRIAPRFGLGSRRSPCRPPPPPHQGPRLRRFPARTLRPPPLPGGDAEGRGRPGTAPERRVGKSEEYSCCAAIAWPDNGTAPEWRWHAVRGREQKIRDWTDAPKRNQTASRQVRQYSATSRRQRRTRDGRTIRPELRNGFAARHCYPATHN